LPTRARSALECAVCGRIGEPPTTTTTTNDKNLQIYFISAALAQCFARPTP
jgi:hypothetical protein